jgi:hypothetical protein
LRIRLDLMGQGEVWVDDVELYDLVFNEAELRALCKLITLANAELQNGQVGDCMKLLEGYWPRFLTQHVPLDPTGSPPGSLAKRPNDAGAPSDQQPSPAAPHTGLMDRMKNMLPDRLRY